MRYSPNLFNQARSMQSVDSSIDQQFNEIPNVFTIPHERLSVASQIEDVQLVYDHQKFLILNAENTAVQMIENYNLPTLLRDITKEKLFMFLMMGSLKLKMIEEEYALEIQPQLKGGGVISGAIGYWLTKALCYGTAVAGAGAAVVATGGAAGAVTGAFATGATLGASTGASIVGGAIAGAGLTSEAALATTAVVSSAGGLAGATAAVETASLAVSYVLTSIPFLP